MTDNLNSTELRLARLEYAVTKITDWIVMWSEQPIEPNYEFRVMMNDIFGARLDKQILALRDGQDPTEV